MKILLATLLTVTMALQALGDVPADSVKVYFRIGYRVFEPSLRNNRADMDRFVNIVREAKEKDNIEKIIVNGFASPDGTSQVNERLARLRCEAIADYISEHTGVRRDFIKTVPGGVAWGELRNMVETYPNVPSREKILEILDYTPIWIFDRNNKIIGGRKSQLMSLDHGETYRWLLTNLFPELRNAVGLSVFFKTIDSAATEIPDITEKTQLETDTVAYEIPYSEPIISETNLIEETETAETNLIEETETTETNLIEETETTETNLIEETETAETNLIEETETAETNLIEETEIADEQDVSAVANQTSGMDKPFYMSVKTNILFDAALIPNLGAEFYLGKNLSLYGEWMYAWWDNDAQHRYWRTYGGDICLKWWFGRKAHSKPLTGHHLGVYGGILTFDFETGDTGYLGGKPGGTLWDRWLVYSGIEYGYSLPVGKRFNIDFSVGFGYMGGHYIKYYPFDNDYYFDKEYNMRYFGPTKVEISLEWLIGRGNTNGRKGGDR